MNDNDPPIDDVPAGVLENTEREKSTRRGSVALLHRWWGRRPAGMARIACYLALTESRLVAGDKDFLVNLCNPTPDVSVVETAKNRIASELGKRLGASAEFAGKASVLDLFAGSGAIAIESARLGCDSYAVDVHPTAYHIMRASWLLADPLVRAEILQLAAKIFEIANSKLSEIYGADGENSILWLNAVKCEKCGELSPLRRSVQLSESEELHVVSSVPWQNEFRQSHAPIGRVAPICMNCGEVVEPAALIPVPGCVIGLGKKRTFKVLQPAEMHTLSVRCSARLNELLDKKIFAGLRSKQEQESLRHLGKYQIESISDLFSKRQLLALLEYVDTANSVVEEFEKAKASSDVQEGVRTGLSFMLSYAAEHNSQLSAWNFREGSVMSIFERISYAVSPAFVETLPQLQCERWLNKLSMAFIDDQLQPKCRDVILGDAKHLPFENAFFDAAFADPPYYDVLPYSQLANFCWAWERPLLEQLTPLITQMSPIRGEKEKCEDDVAQALIEAFRVLKPGGSFVLFLFGKSEINGFNAYVKIAQEKCGFELVNLVRFPDVSRVMADSQQHSYLAYFRKPGISASRGELEVKVEELFEKAERGERVLQDGLGHFLHERLMSEELDALVEKYLPNGQGTQLERVLEVVSWCPDLKELLVECFGFRIKKIANEFREANSQLANQADIEVVLSHFGYHVPAPGKQIGPEQLIKQLNIAASTINQATDKAGVRGPFDDAVGAFESYLKRSMLHLSRLIYGERSEAVLLEVLKKSNERANLSKLLFGDILSLYRELPDFIASSDEAEIVKQKFGRQHIYNPKDKRMRLAERLAEVVEWRNKVQHDKANYCSDSSQGQMVNDLKTVLEKAASLVADMLASRSIARLATPVLEMKDRWNRMSYKLEMDDGTVLQIGIGIENSMRLELGEAYLYFASDTNPKPVDPLIIKLDKRL